MTRTQDGGAVLFRSAVARVCCSTPGRQRTSRHEENLQEAACATTMAVARRTSSDDNSGCGDVPKHGIPSPSVDQEAEHMVVDSPADGQCSTPQFVQEITNNSISPIAATRDSIEGPTCPPQEELEVQESEPNHSHQHAGEESFCRRFSSDRGDREDTTCSHHILPNTASVTYSDRLTVDREETTVAISEEVHELPVMVETLNGPDGMVESGRANETVLEDICADVSDDTNSGCGLAAPADALSSEVQCSLDAADCPVAQSPEVAMVHVFGDVGLMRSSNRKPSWDMEPQVWARRALHDMGFEEHEILRVSEPDQDRGRIFCVAEVLVTPVPEGFYEAWPEEVQDTSSPSVSPSKSSGNRSRGATDDQNDELAVGKCFGRWRVKVPASGKTTPARASKTSATRGTEVGKDGATHNGHSRLPGDWSDSRGEAWFGAWDANNAWHQQAASWQYGWRPDAPMAALRGAWMRPSIWPGGEFGLPASRLPWRSCYQSTLAFAMRNAFCREEASAAAATAKKSARSQTSAGPERDGHVNTARSTAAAMAVSAVAAFTAAVTPAQAAQEKDSVAKEHRSRSVGSGRTRGSADRESRGQQTSTRSYNFAQMPTVSGHLPPRSSEAASFRDGIAMGTASRAGRTLGGAGHYSVAKTCCDAGKDGEEQPRTRIRAHLAVFFLMFAWLLSELAWLFRTTAADNLPYPKGCEVCSAFATAGAAAAAGAAAGAAGGEVLPLFRFLPSRFSI